MDSMTQIVNAFQEHQDVLEKTKILLPQIQQISNQIIERIHNKGTIFFMGNGGSAADAQHLAAELIGRFTKERQPIPAIALTTDTSVLTCLSNDYNYDIIFARQLQALCKPNDVVIGISTSGNSPSVLNGIETANQIGAFTIGLTGGSGGKLAIMTDECLTIPSSSTARIQEMHILIGHTLCELIELAVIEKAALTETDSDNLLTQAKMPSGIINLWELLKKRPWKGTRTKQDIDKQMSDERSY